MEDEEVLLDRIYVRLGAFLMLPHHSLLSTQIYQLLKMKEMNLWIKQVKHETLLVKLHIIEVKTDQALTLRQLGLNDLDLKNWPVPVWPHCWRDL